MYGLLGVWMGCSSVTPPPAPPSPPPAAAPASAPAVDPLQAAIQELKGTLKGKLMSAMSSGGPVKAVTVCHEEAKALTDTIAAKHGVNLGRASLKLRNPADAGPGWVQDWLKSNQGAPAAEVKPLTGPDRRLEPILLDAPCLACHGAPETIAPDVRAALTQHYPADAAVGYAVGDLRGAYWAERR